MFIMGIFISLFGATHSTLFHEKIEQNIQGRMFSLVQTISSVIVPLGMLIFGPLGDFLNIRILFIISGLLMIMLGIISLYNKILNWNN